MVQKGTKDGFSQSQTSCHKAFVACIQWPETWNCNHECCPIRIVTRFFLNSPWLIFNTGPRDLILQVPSSDDAFPLLEVPSGFLLGDISCGFTKKQKNLVLKNCDLLYFYNFVTSHFHPGQLMSMGINQVCMQSSWQFSTNQHFPRSCALFGTLVQDFINYTDVTTYDQIDVYA